MNEKRLREAILQRIEIANAKELSAIWHFVWAFIDLAERGGAGRE